MLQLSEEYISATKPSTSYFDSNLEVRNKTNCAIRNNSLITFLTYTGFKDAIAEKVFPSDGPTGLVPMQTYGEGNCLFRAVSRILCGDETMHVELRMRTFLELCLNKNKYLNNLFLKELTGLDNYVDSLLDSSFDTSSLTRGKSKAERQMEGFEKGIVDTIIPGTYSGMWHIFAL